MKFAIIGIGCRFPKSDSPQEFYDNIRNKRDCVDEIPDDRVSKDVYVDSNKSRNGRLITKRGGFMNHFFDFDHESFGISGKEASSMDPQQKILLEVSHQALEDSRMKYKGTNTGVFIGVGQSDYSRISTNNPYYVNQYSATGTALSICSNRLSYIFDLRGPSLSIDTACSSSGSAMHIACQSLISNDCETALVGGINMLLNHSMSIAFNKLGVLSPDGKCKSFDASANGYVRSEGCSIVVLKSLEKAVKDNDHIYAVISSTSANQDGMQSPSLTMPSQIGQSNVIKQALKKANINPEEVSYVECHATGTNIGDPTEVNTIGEILYTPQRRYPLRIGSVKCNVGHAECASYMAGLVKCCLMMDKKEYLPNIHFKNPNPKIKFDQYNLKVQEENEEMNREDKYFMVSSFGFGGANVCTILEKPPVAEEEIYQTPLKSEKNLYVCSANTKKALESRIEQIRKLELHGDETSLSYNLNNMYHESNNFQTYAISKSLQEAKFCDYVRKSDMKKPLAFIFSGQGPQSYVMGRTLYKTIPVFRSTIDICDGLFKKYSGVSLLSDLGLFTDIEEVYKNKDPNLVNNIDVTLPSLIFIQIALYELWKSVLQRDPDVIVGHSFGEMCVLYASGACTLEEVIELTSIRCNLMKKIDNQGTMIALGCGQEQANKIIKKLNLEKIWIAAYNSPVSVTLGGIVESVMKVHEECDKLGIFNRVLRVTNAYHTPLLNPLKDEAVSSFSQSKIMSKKPSKRLISTVTGQFWDEPFQSGYFWDNIESPVHFNESIDLILKEFGQDTVFIEMAPHPVLSISMKQCGVTNTIYSIHRKEVENESIYRACFQALSHNFSVNWKVLYGKNFKSLQYLPTYPFQRKKCFFEDPFHKNERFPIEYQPLAGYLQTVSSPTYQNYINTNTYPWLADHVVQDAIVFPAAAYIEMFLESLGHSLENVEILRAMNVPSEELSYRITNTVLNDKSNQAHIYSKQENDKSWVSQARAQKSIPTNTETLKHNGILELFKKNVEGNFLDRKECYSRFEVMNLSYGKSFQCVEKLWRGDEESFAILSGTHLKEFSDFAKYIIHPALLDCSFQCFLGALKSCASTFLPTKLGKLNVHSSNSIIDKVYIYCRISSRSKQTIVGDILAFDSLENGNLVFDIRNFECTKVSSGIEISTPLYSTTYQTVDLPHIEINKEEVTNVLQNNEMINKNTLINSPFVYKYQIAKVLKEIDQTLLKETKTPFAQWCDKFVSENNSLSNGFSEDSKDSESLDSQLLNSMLKNLEVLLKGQNHKATSDLLDKFLSTSQLFTKQRAASLLIVKEALNQFNKENNTRVVSILDFNGNFESSKQLVDYLEANYSNRVEYTVDDKYLTKPQKVELSERTFVKFVQPDMKKSLNEQLTAKFDIVFSANLVYRSDESSSIYKELRKLLTPNGLLLAIENSSSNDFIDFVYGAKDPEWFSKKNKDIDSLIQTLKGNNFNISHTFEESNVSVLIATINTEAQLDVEQQISEIRPTEPLELLHTFKRMVEKQEKSSLLIVTEDGLSGNNPNSTSMIAMSRVFANENSNVLTKILDIDSSIIKEKRDKWVQAFLTNYQSYDELEYYVNKENKLVVPRVSYKVDLNEIDENTPLSENEQEPYRLECGKGGLLDSLSFKKFRETQTLPQGHAFVRVRAAPLNFKDVMLAMNMIQVKNKYLGLEFAGVIEKVDPLSEFKVGDEVFGFAQHCIGSHVIADELTMVKKPKNLSFEEASSIPAVFVTSYLALIKKANISKDENVLIHSGAGGVGQASIQLCNWKQANVYATVGTDSKRKYLTEKYNVERFGNSHSSNWDEEILSLTPNKQGIDVVLNSLSGEHIDKSLKVLCPFGRFVEIGKRDILEDKNIGLKPFLENLSYHSVHLDLLTEQRPYVVGQLLKEVNTLFEKGILKPIVDKVFNHSNIIDAFRYMQQGKHLGKIVVSFDKSNKVDVYPSSNLFDSQGTYILTGGLGAVGFEICTWMVEKQGARNVILLSRSGVLSKEQRRTIDRLEKQTKCNIILMKVDVTNDESVQNMYNELSKGYLHLKNNLVVAESEESDLRKVHLSKVSGIIHLAMVLDDDVIPKIDEQRFNRVLKPKVDGVQSMMKPFLHGTNTLDFVLLFSSISAVIGNAEQVNYAAANSYLDGYAHLLNNQFNINAKVLNLGAVDDVGVIANDHRLRKLMFARGLNKTVNVHQICNTIQYIIRQDSHNVQFMSELNFSSLVESTPAIASKISHLVQHDNSSEQSDGALSEEAIQKKMENLVSKISSLLMIDVASIDYDEKLTTYGVDSLLAVEISSLIQKLLKVKCSQMDILSSGLTINQIREKIHAN